jgi:tetratricopeptide (TPR) repeat protein
MGMRNRIPGPLLIAAALAWACAASGTSAATLEEIIGATADRLGRPIPDYLQPWIARDREWGQQHRVLVEMTAGRIAFMKGDWAQAEGLLADAQTQVETIYADNPKAKAARSVFVPESTKDFKGDPYERAMLGVYLGLIDLSRGDFDNARAGFRSAQLQLTWSASEQYEDDMALAQYLVGWSYWCEGSRSSAAEEFAQAQKLRADLVPPRPADNLLMLAEVGAAPVKIRAGQYGEVQRMRAGAPSPMQQVAFRVPSASGPPAFVPAVMAEDLLLQSDTRGGRAIDGIRAGKASFRSGADSVKNAGASVSTVALGAAAIQGYTGRDSRAMSGIGVVAGLVALTAKGVSSSAETQADIRYWSNLPERIYLATGRIEPGTDGVETGYYSFSGKPLQGMQRVTRWSTRRECAVHITQSIDSAGRFDRTPAAAWPALASLKPAQGLVNYEYLVTSDGADEGEALLDNFKKSRDTAR